jgi:hypothetical protein
MKRHRRQQEGVKVEAPGGHLWNSGGVFQLITDRSGAAGAAPDPGVCGCETARPVH